MGEGWLTQIVTDRWFLAIAAYFLGLLTGWLVWTRALSKFDQPTQARAESDLKDEASASGDKLEELEAEISKARSLLEESEEEGETYADLLSSLDDAIKRANGRLKLILKSIKRAEKGD